MAHEIQCCQISLWEWLGAPTRIPTPHPKQIIHGYTLHSQVLENVSSAKYFDVKITDDLEWGQHINEITIRVTLEKCLKNSNGQICKKDDTRLLGLYSTKFITILLLYIRIGTCLGPVEGAGEPGPIPFSITVRTLKNSFFPRESYNLEWPYNRNCLFRDSG